MSDWWFLDSRMTVKADSGMTGGAYTLLEFTAERGFAPPRHVHREEDEAFVVMTGSLRGILGDEEWEATEGSFVFLPRGIPHTFVVTSAKPLVALQLTNPAGFERFVTELGRPAEGPGLPPPSEPDIPRLVEVAQRHGYDIVGPPLELSIDAAHPGVVVPDSF